MVVPITIFDHNFWHSEVGREAMNRMFLRDFWVLLVGGLIFCCATLLRPGCMLKKDLIRGMSVIGGVLMTTIDYPVKAVDNTRIITHKVFLDIKIANYTEESNGKNRGAKG